MKQQKALEIKTLRTPEELLELIHTIEQELKRVRKIHWGPRTIDLDIILFNDQIIQKDLTLKILGELEFVIPPEELQSEFEIFVTQVTKSKVAVQKALDETQILFDSLMQEYFG